MAGVLFLANGKRAQDGKTNNEFTSKIGYPTSKISSEQPVLAGWRVAKSCSGCIRTLWESIQWCLGSVCPGCRHGRARATHTASLAPPVLNNGWGTQEAGSCCRRGKYNRVALKEHPMGWEKRMTKSCLQVPYENTKLLVRWAG